MAEGRYIVMPRYILSDVDDTKLKWKDKFAEYLGTRDVGNGDFDQHASIEAWLGFSREAVVDLVYAFQHSRHFGQLEPVEGAVEAVRELVDAGYRFIDITACGRDERLLEARRRNLLEVFGDVVDEIHLVDVHETKMQYLKLYEPTWWVENDPRHAVAGTTAGHRSILIETGDNRTFRHPQVTMLPTWAAIRDTILA